jgi:hypothetical protein
MSTKTKGSIYAYYQAWKASSFGVVPTWHTQDTQGSEYGYGIPTIEEPDRAMQQLANLAKGHALLTGRNYVTIEDLPIIIKVVLSTAPSYSI